MDFKKLNGGKNIEWFTKDLDQVKLDEICGRRLHLKNFDLLRVKNPMNGDAFEYKFIMAFHELPGAFAYANNIIGDKLQAIVDEGAKDEACDGNTTAVIFQKVTGKRNSYFNVEFVD